MHRMAGSGPDEQRSDQSRACGHQAFDWHSRNAQGAGNSRDGSRLVEEMPSDLCGLRDRALLVLGFAGALRRSELVALDVSDLEETAEGLHVRIKRSKTDQEGAGDFVSIPHGSRLRPVAAAKAWLQAAGITEGPIFRSIKKGGSVTLERLSDRSVAQIIKDRAGAADSTRHSSQVTACVRASSLQLYTMGLIFSA